MTKRERNKVYKKVLEWYVMPGGGWLKGRCYGFCGAFASRDAGDLSLYPEIMKHKPHYLCSLLFWFSRDRAGYLKRIDILKQAIRETERKRKEVE